MNGKPFLHVENPLVIIAITFTQLTYATPTSYFYHPKLSQKPSHQIFLLTPLMIQNHLRLISQALATTAKLI